MRFRFSAPDAQGLRVIEEIPDFEICQLEGRNGIGKSLSARLLELLTGGQPYASLPEAWTTLGQLGPTVVTVEGLARGDRLEFRFDPSSWPDSPPVVPDESLGAVLLNGSPATWAQARGLLRVVRIAGDESLVETMGRTLREYGVEAGAADRRLRPAVAIWSERLEQMREMCAVHPDELLGRQERLIAARAASGDANSRAVTAAAVLADAETARAVLAEMLRRKESLPAVISRLEDGEQQRQSAVAEIDELAQRGAALVEARGRQRQLSEQIALWERRGVLRSRALNAAMVAERQALRALGFAERPTKRDIVGRTRATELALTQLYEQIAEADVAQTVRGLGSRLERSIADSPAVVQRAVVAVTPQERLTGAQLAESLRRRYEQLSGRPTPGEAARLDAERRRVLQTQDALRRLPGLIEATDRKQRNADEAQVRLRALYVADGATSGDELDLLAEQEAARHRLVAAGIALAQADADARELLGLDPPLPDVAQDGVLTATEPAITDADAEDADGAREDDNPEGDDAPAVGAAGRGPWLSALDVRQRWAEVDAEARRRLHDCGAGGLLPTNPDVQAHRRAGAEAAAREASARTAVEEAAHLEIVAAQEEQAAAHALLDLRLSLRAALRALAADERWQEWRPGAEAAFARAAVPLAGALTELEAADPARAPVQETEVAASTVLQSLSDLASQMAEAAARVRDGLSALEGHLINRAARMAPRDNPPRVAHDPASVLARPAADQVVADALLPWIEDVLSGLVSTPELLKELFDGADQVRIDLTRLQAVWRAEDHRPRRRPLEAFSSGEQAFLYTKAKLEQHADLRLDHERVVFVLDEFGAFVARDRFGQLLAHVRNRALGVTADQIVFMLPLSVDYLADPAAAAIVSGVDVADGSTNDRVRQLEERQYFAIPGGQGP